jgi:hypothetical protein
MRLGRGASIGGTVLAGGRPAAGAQVALSLAGDLGFRPWRPTSGSSRSASATVTIAPGQAAAAEIVFEQGFRVDGRVSRGGRPVTDAIVSAMPEGGGRRSASARTDEAGGFVLEGLDEGRQSGRPLGEVGVRIEKEGAGTRVVNTASTDSSGRFALADLEARRYRVSW